MKFGVPNMTCGHCSGTIEKRILEVDPVAMVSFDMDARTVEVDSALSAQELAAVMKDAGYEPSSVS